MQIAACARVDRIRVTAVSFVAALREPTPVQRPMQTRTSILEPERLRGAGCPSASELDGPTDRQGAIRVPSTTRVGVAQPAP